MYLSKEQMKETFEQNGWDMYILKGRSGANEIPYCDIWANHRFKDKESKVEVTLHVAYDAEIFCENLLSTVDKFHNVGETRVKLVRDNSGELPLVQSGDTRDTLADAILREEGERKNIYELFANCQNEYILEEIEWGGPVGEEIW